MHKLAAFALLLTPALRAQDPRQIIEEVQRRQRSQSQRYEGTLEVIGAENRVATKRWIFERIGTFGESKALLRFVAPAEVKGVGLLIVNHPDRASDQWMWRPSIGRDQRIAMQDRSTRFFGTDFSFEDLEERDVNQFDFKLLGEENAAWKIESRPRKSSQVHAFRPVDQEGQLHAAARGSVQQERPFALDRIPRLRADQKHLDRSHHRSHRRRAQEPDHP
jgi:hypothetical protein